MGRVQHPDLQATSSGWQYGIVAVEEPFQKLGGDSAQHIKNAVTTRASGMVRVASRDLEGKHQAYGPTGTSSLMVRAIEKLSKFSYAT